MKTLLALLLTAVLLFSMVACTPERNEGTVPNTVPDPIPGTLDTADPTAPAHTNGLTNGRHAQDPVA